MTFKTCIKLQVKKHQGINSLVSDIFPPLARALSLQSYLYPLARISHLLNKPACILSGLALIGDVQRHRTIVRRFVCSALTSVLPLRFRFQSPCSLWPCQNNGTCVSQYQKNSYVCLCTKEFSGKLCQTSKKVFHSYFISGRKTIQKYLPSHR